LSNIFKLYFLEIFLGGGGRVFQAYGITLRMILFSLIILYFIKDILVNKKIKGDRCFLLINGILLFWIAFSGFIGILNDASVLDIISDIKPLSYLFIIPPLIHFFCLKKINPKEIYNILVYSLAIVVTLSLTLTLLISIGYFNNISILRNDIDNYIGSFEIGIRANGAVYYNGFYYLLIGVLMVYSKIKVSSTRKFEKVFFILGSLTLVASTTKGLIISLILGIIIIGNVSSKRIDKKIIKNIIFIISMIMIYSFILIKIPYFERILVSNSLSEKGVMIRIAYTKEALSAMNNLKVFIGQGLGFSLPSEGAGHLENSFLEILLEQGIIGLMIWLSYIFITCKKLLNIFKSEEDFFSLGLFTGVVVTTILTLTNPYINNPLGISLLGISMGYISQKKLKIEVLEN